MKNATPLQWIGLGVLVLAIILGVSKSRGAPVQPAQVVGVDPAVHEAQLQDAAVQGYQQGAEQATKQIVEALAPSPAPRFVDARDELKSAGYEAVALTSEPVCSGLPFWHTDRVIGQADHHLIIKYSADAFRSNPSGFGCEYLVLDVPPGSEFDIAALNPLDCILATKRAYSPVMISFPTGQAFPVAVFRPSALVPNGWKFNFGESYCINGSGQPKG